VLAGGLELFSGAEAAVGGVIGEQNFDVLVVDGGALRLAAGAKGPPTSGPSFQSRPSQRRESKIICALADEDEVQQADVGCADVGVAGGRGCDADSGRHRCFVVPLIHTESM
jgi:hypothetical protein